MLAQQLQKLFGITGETPPAILPPMVMGVKGRSFTAQYINKDVLPGTEASTYNGATLMGWGNLPTDLRKPGGWVKMHLLPHKLGGDAVDSNLVPASSPKTNVPFSHGIEQDAITAKEGGEVIWYRMTVAFHSGPMHAYPTSLASKWGTYKEDRGSWVKKDKPGGQYSKSPIDPPAVRTVLDFADPAITAGDIGAFLGIKDMSFPKVIWRVMPTGGYTTATDLLARMRQQHQQNVTQKKQVTTDFETKMTDLAARLAAKAGSLKWAP
jgi:hypothetical protein